MPEGGESAGEAEREFCLPLPGEPGSELPPSLPKRDGRLREILRGQGFGETGGEQSFWGLHFLLIMIS